MHGPCSETGMYMTVGIIFYQVFIGKLSVMY